MILKNMTMKKNECYFNRLMDFRNEAIAKIKEILGDKSIDLTEENIAIVVESSGGCYTEYIRSISNSGFKTCDGAYTLESLYVEDLCYVLDYLIENKVAN